jgi:hypothetical protein
MARHDRVLFPKLPIVACAAAIAAVVLALLWQGWDNRRAAVSFDPPYPPVDAAGAPILAVFEGRIPCSIPNCQQRKVGLVLYQHGTAGNSGTYWLGLVRVGIGSGRDVVQGAWTTRRGVDAYPEAVVYELDSKAPDDLRRFWRVTTEILLPLDDSQRPKAGNAAWGYMLSRYAAPYGPRTYRD